MTETRQHADFTRTFTPGLTLVRLAQRLLQLLLHVTQLAQQRGALSAVAGAHGLLLLRCHRGALGARALQRRLGGGRLQHRLLGLHLRGLWPGWKWVQGQCVHWKYII